MSRTLGFRLFLAAACMAAVALAAIGYFLFTSPMQAKLVIGAGQTDSESFELARAIANVVTRVHAGVDVGVVATTGASDSARRLAEGSIDLALVEGDATVRQNVSVVATLYPDLFQLVVRADSGIASINDLEGKRIALPPVTSGEFRAFWFLANHYGVAPERLDAVPMPEEEASKSILDGDVDALFRVAGIRNKQITQLFNRGPLALVPIDQGDAMHLRDPAFRASTIPKGAYRGDLPMPREDLPTLAVDRILVARSNLSADVVRAVTKVLFENRRDLALRMPLAAFISQPSMDTGTLIPVHPGAIDYYTRERPSLLEEKAEFFALLLSLAVVLGTIGVAIKRRIHEHKKSRIEDYAAELLDVEARAKVCRTIAELNVQKDELTRLLARVVDDVRARRVNAEGLQLFAFVWESVNYTVNDHEEQLRLGPAVAGGRRALRRPDDTEATSAAP